MVFSLFDCLNHFHESGRITTSVSANPTAPKESLDKEQMALLLGILLNETSLSLDDIVHRIGYSKRQTQRMIREVYGKSFRDLRQDMLFTSACRLMKENLSLSIRDICRKAGFSKYSVMRNVFLRKCGKTPEEFRDHPEREAADK